MIETIFTSGILIGLITGSYAYTYNSNKNKASKEDIKDLRDRVNILYNHLLNKNIDEELEKTNGDKD